MQNLITSTIKRMRFAWTHNLGLRLGIGLSLILFLVMGAGTGILIVHQEHTLRQAAEGRARAVAHAFAAVGSAAVLDNLFRVQESLQARMQDNSLLEIDIVDRDSMIVASKQPARIGIVLDNDPAWHEVQQTKRETTVETRLTDGQRVLIVIAPLFDREELAAWVRMVVSLTEIEQEQSQTLWRLLAITVMIIAAGLYAIQRTLDRTGMALHSITSVLQSAVAVRGPHETPILPPNSHIAPRGDFEALVASTTAAAAILKEQSLALHAFAQSLEEKVLSRTAQLEEARAEAIRSLEELRENDARLRSLVDNAADGIMVTDTEWIVESANPAACVLFDHTPAVLQGRKILDFLIRTTDDRNQSKDKSIRSRFVIGTCITAVGQRKDGTSFPAEVSISTLTLAGIPHYTIIIRDVSERQHMEALKEHSARRLQKIWEERANMYHDLHNNLLQSLSAVGMGLEASKLLLADGPTHRVVHQLDHTLSNLRHVIQEARDFLSHLELRTIVHDDFLYSLQKLVQSKDEGPCPTFSIDVEPHLAEQLSIEQEIHFLAIAQEAVHNTLHHAGASNGRIRFWLERGAAHMEIHDDGVGFDPTQGDHNGPGITNMATHAKQLHGRLTIKSAPGKGTSILITVPQLQGTHLLGEIAPTP